MDTSKEYIEMCRKAREIQNLRGNDEGDFYQDGSFVRIANEPCSDDCYHTLVYDGCVWLPRQDQLIEMLNMFWMDAWISCFQYAQEQSWNFGSQEQVWLSFVMATKFNKSWTGKNWN